MAALCDMCRNPDATPVRRYAVTLKTGNLLCIDRQAELCNECAGTMIGALTLATSCRTLPVLSRAMDAAVAELRAARAAETHLPEVTP